MDIGAGSTLCAPALPGDDADGWSGQEPHATRVPAGQALFPGARLPSRIAEFTSGDIRPGARFVLIELIGAGAFGKVWKAHDLLLDRHVAIKIAHAPVADCLTPAMLEEARLAAQLRHQNIVGVHELDVQGRFVFIVSDLIDGDTLAAWRTSGRQTLSTILQVTEKIARALHHAHARGVVHRDLKPENIMIGRDGEPTLVDFGLGLRASQRLPADSSPLVVGTPSYMSPEQARGDSHNVDHRADLYALGVILFELLTDSLPFSGGAREVMRQRLHSSVPRLRDFNRAVPRDLEAVCLKCLAQAPDDRYSSALDLADDLARCATGEPVHARPLGVLRRAGRFILRHPVALTVAALLLSAAAVSEIALWQRGRSQSALQRREVNADLHAGLSWVQRMHALARTPDHATAIELVEQLRRSGALAPQRYYDLACIYAVASESAARDQSAVVPGRPPLADQYRAAACDLLAQARSAGYFKSPDCRKLMPADPHLRSLRNDPQFVQFVKALQEQET